MSGILRREQLAMLMACFGHVITIVAQDVFACICHVPLQNTESTQIVKSYFQQCDFGIDGHCVWTAQLQKELKDREVKRLDERILVWQLSPVQQNEQRPKTFMQKPLHERSYGGTCCPNHGKQYGELLVLKAIT